MVLLERPGPCCHILSATRALPPPRPQAADCRHNPARLPPSHGRHSHTISVRGAREHNLKNVDLTIPRDALIVFTGLSGSGKSSLAFDTIYAEGQRRYVESLSAYARQFLEMMQKPDVDHIDGLSPAISIEQKTTSRNPRSTVGTVTEIYDYLRLLFARAGVPHSPATGLPIESQTVSQMVDKVLALPEGTRLYLLAPLVRGRKGEFRKELAELMKKGYQRVKINGSFYEIPEAPKLDKKFKHDIDVVIDRLVVRADIAQRLAESFEQALAISDGLAIAELADKPLGGTARLPRRRRRPGRRRKAREMLPRPPRSRRQATTTATAPACNRASSATRTRPMSGSPFPPASPARSRASPSRRSNRACFRSTPPPAPARNAMASAPN